ncbi:ribosome biogenesis protein NOP53 [Ischnura elegans]|uniref:ribosome biogenesis protein NOP53 n=1 Tax=Ischnura elegans TaxID=197161 RepID=UPI001ED86981|nr:ribosome biogenesis protein NOP53 [Ischnura elegans]
MADVQGKRKKVSKKNKKAWRKFIDTKDVDAFLDEKRQEERIGSFKDVPDEELFSIDAAKKDAKEKIIAKKKEKFLRPYRCLEVLQPSSAVPDPITKRNKGKPAEERKSDFVKRMEEKKRLGGHWRNKHQKIIQNRNLADVIRKDRLKKHDFTKDLWAETPKDPPKEEVDVSWIRKGAYVHVLANTGSRMKMRPRTMEVETSVLTPVEAPHPGTSYNPTFHEHRELLSKVVEDEMKVIKEEEHLDRVITNMIPKVTREEVEENWLKEMSQGLPEFAEQKEGEDSGVEEDSVESGHVGNPIVTRDKKKTLQKRRKIREAKAEIIKRREAKLEKKKLSDIERVKLLKKDISKRDQKLEMLRKKRERVKKAKIVQPKMLSSHKFEPLEMEFSMKNDLAGNLRNIKPEGSVLKDRFKRMQERNVIETRIRQKKKLKYKRKVFEKASHKMGWEPKGYD